VSNQRKLRRQTVELDPPPARPSRIRRDPPGVVPERKAVQPYPTHREVLVVVIGVVVFALAISVIIFGISDYTSR
jgi:hypothetical protein